MKKYKINISLLFLFIAGLFSVIYGQTNICTTCPPNSTSTLIFSEPFGSGSYSIPSGNPSAPVLGNMGNAGHYIITNQNASVTNHQWNLPQDHTSTGDNYYMLVDGFDNLQTCLFRKTISVTAGKEYIFCAWLANVYNKGYNYTPPTIELRVNGTPIDGSLVLAEQSGWIVKSIGWTANTNSNVEFSIVMTTTAKLGDDIALDDISITECAPKLQCKCELGQTNVVGYSPNGLMNNLNMNSGSVIKAGSVCVCQPIKVEVNYKCSSKECASSTSWEVNGPDGFHVEQIKGINNPLNAIFTPTEPGIYTVLIKIKCGDSECDYRISVSVDKIVQCNGGIK
jgi:hypothetical protein